MCGSLEVEMLFAAIPTTCYLLFTDNCFQHYSDVIIGRRLDCLFNRLCRHISKKTPKLCVTGLCEGTSPVVGEFPSRRPSNEENISIWWRHYDCKVAKLCIFSCLKWSLDNCVNFRQQMYTFIDGSLHKINGHIVSTVVRIKVVFVLFYLCFKSNNSYHDPNDRYCEFVENTECPKVSRSFVVYSRCAERWYFGINTHTHKFDK